MRKVGREDRAVLRKFASWNSPINIGQSGHFTLAKSLNKSGEVYLYATSWLSNSVPPPGLYHGKFATTMGKYMIDKKAQNPAQISPGLLRSKVVSRFELTKCDLEAYKLGEVSFYLTDSTTKECEYPPSFYLPEGATNTFDPEPEQHLDFHTVHDGMGSILVVRNATKGFRNGFVIDKRALSSIPKEDYFAKLLENGLLVLESKLSGFWIYCMMTQIAPEN